MNTTQDSIFRKAAEGVDIAVVGAGAAGLMAAVAASQQKAKVVVCEQLKRPGQKLLATGKGRCNLSNTLPTAALIERFGKQGRFMAPALQKLDSQGLRDLLQTMGVATHAPDGFRVFPTSHRSVTVVDALRKAVGQHNILPQCEVKGLWLDQQLQEQPVLLGLETSRGRIRCARVIIATGGLSYPELGATGTGYQLARSVGHTIADTYPAMVPLETRESWPAHCTAHTVPAVTMTIARTQRTKKISATGDLIFARGGIAGPVVLDLSRELPPLLAKQKEVPVWLSLTTIKKEPEWQAKLRQLKTQHAAKLAVEVLQPWVPPPLARVLCGLASIRKEQRCGELSKQQLTELAQVLTKTPLTITGTGGYSKAMITRGGVRLNEVDPKTLQSRRQPSLYFAGEILDLDGPCGGYNLQWAFSSGWLAGDACGRAISAVQSQIGPFT